MPEHEFEIYLSLLGKLLKLSPAQKAAISDEFRDHLEERLSGLIQSGMTREEAIRTAMDEFGDVNGLAIDLTRASRTPLRTVAFRSTIVASIVAVAIVGWITLFVPEHRIAAPPAVQAEHKEADNQSVTQRNNVAPPATELSIQDKELFPEFLTKQTDVNFDNAPLREICRTLESIHGIPVVIQKSSLSDEGLSGDSPVTLKLTGLTFEEVLNHLTGKLNITWQVHGGLVQITTYDRQKYFTRQYDLHELANRGHKLGSLMTALMTTSYDQWTKWEAIDGEGGTLTPVGKTLVVRQSFKCHRKVARILAAIEAPNPSVLMLETCTGRDRMMEALKENSSIDVVETPLSDALQFLAEQHKIPIAIDERSLEEEGLNGQSTVTLNLKDRPLSTILEFLFDEWSLAFQLRDGVVRISTESGAQSDMTIARYNVTDLISQGVTNGQLITAIMQSNRDNKWEMIDGEGGTMAVTNVGGSLLVKQSDQAHRQIRQLLDQLRANSHGQETADGTSAAEPKMITKDYRMPKDVAVNLMTALPNLVAPGRWKTVPEHEDSPIIEMIASRPLVENVAGLVSGGSDEVRVLSSAAESSKNPGKRDHTESKQIQSVVSRPRSSLVIRQTPEIHRQIKELLQKLNVDFVEGTTFQKTDGFSDGIRGFQGGGMGGSGFGGGFGGGGGMGGGMF